MSNAPGELLVTYASLSQAANEIRRQSQELMNDLEEIKSAVRTVAAGWEGEAKQSYDTVQAVWDQNAAKVQAALGQISAAVETAGSNYQSTDKKAAGLFGG
ncbi:ESAT-6-like protein EsxA [Streptomyces sp. RB5]|uniref:ESAT-6-like protein n=1 Tax=Streptomyces smaragdinus TaxID=2585196 RepID=A0A7K0CRY2_9ACTN|nr:WXG100 family type VII secretion target [Streptomyces smaragdinus]MQY16180.1 ESAT-6-like protein EsxA [Streptomyces smaragdinus]